MVAKLKNCLGVDIGSQTIRIAHIERGKAGPRVLALLEEPLHLERSLSEAQKRQRIGRQIQDMVKRAGIRATNAVFCVPGLSAMIKRIKLPKTSSVGLQRMIQFEARQQIPFPLDVSMLEYQVFEEENSSEVNVLLAAVKRDYINGFMKMINRAGLRPIGISISSLALYNFHEVNETDRELDPKPEASGPLAFLKKRSGGKGKSGRDADASEAVEDEAPLDEMGFEEVKAYVHVGASLMDITIPKPGPSGMIGFPRSVPLAGNEMDRAIRSKLHLDDPVEARQLKEERGAVLSTMYEPATDEQAEPEADEAITQVADRMVAELRRSLDFYISQPDGVAVDSLVLSGGLAQLPHLSDYIEEKLGLPVEVAEPKNAAIRMPDPLPDPFSPFAIAVGLAYQGLGYARNEINLLPEDIKNVRSFQNRRYEVAAMLGGLGLIVALSANVGSNEIASYRRDAENYRIQIAQKEKESKEISQVQAHAGQVEAAYKALAATVGRRDFWLQFLVDFVERRPADILIDDLYLRQDGHVVAHGRSPRPSSISAFLKELETLDVVKASALNTIRPTRDARFPGQVQVSEFWFTLKVPVLQGRVNYIGQQPIEPEPSRSAASSQSRGYMFGTTPANEPGRRRFY